MIEKEQNLPYYLKYSQVLIGLVATVYALYISQDIILPIIYSFVFAILINPIVNFLTSKKTNRVVAIFIALLFALILFVGLFYFIASQASLFSDAFPQLKIKFNTMINDIIGWVSQNFNVSKYKIKLWLVKMENEGLNSSSSMIGQTLSTISGVFIIAFLIPVYTFMILYYKPLLLNFISKLFSREKHATVVDVLEQSKSLIQNYLLGLLIEAVLVAFLNSVGLLIIGLDYAILLGIIGALLNIIPYIGGIIAIALPMILAFATKSPTDAFFVLMAYTLVQFIDNNFIVPKIVASKVKINALVSIIVVLIGGAIWGVAGMFLSIPLTAIIKVILDRVEHLKPLGYLLGDELPDPGKNSFKKS